MTVEQLRAALLLMPDDAIVWWSDYDVEWMEDDYYTIKSISRGRIEPEQIAKADVPAWSSSVPTKEEK